MRVPSRCIGASLPSVSVRDILTNYITVTSSTNQNAVRTLKILSQRQSLFKGYETYRFMSIIDVPNVLASPSGHAGIDELVNGTLVWRLACLNYCDWQISHEKYIAFPS